MTPELTVVNMYVYIFWKYSFYIIFLHNDSLLLFIFLSDNMTLLNVYNMFKINDKNLHFLVVPKTYQTVTPKLRYKPNREFCVLLHP